MCPENIPFRHQAFSNPKIRGHFHANLRLDGDRNKHSPCHQNLRVVQAGLVDQGVLEDPKKSEHRQAFLKSSLLEMYVDWLDENVIEEKCLRTSVM